MENESAPAMAKHGVREWQVGRFGLFGLDFCFVLHQGKLKRNIINYNHMKQPMADFN